MTRLKALKIVLVVVGVFFMVGLMPMMTFWPASWAWEPRQSEYEQMIMGVYATLGLFLVLASFKPMEHRSLIQFTIWSSFVHATIMLVQALVDKHEHPNLMGDVPGLYLVGILLWVLLPKKESH